MIHVEHLTKTFGATTAVDDISFGVAEGETFILLGTSGCGKTTTLRMINRLTEPDSGHIRVAERDIRQEKPEILRRKIGYVMQDTGLFPHYTIEENITIVPRLLDWPKEKTRERSEELMEKFHLPPARFMKLYPRQLSGGEQQRVGFIRAMMADPPVMLMDEPLGALDPVTRAGIRREFKALEELRRKTIVLVTHDIEEAFELGDRICLMSRGKILQTGRPEELLLHPTDNFVKTFFDGQRFQLELKTIRLADLWDLLPDIPAQENAGAVLDSESSVLQVLEQTDDRPLMIKNKRMGKTKVAEMDKIMQAFRRLRGKDIEY